jgi:hypothetical protein
MTLNQTKRLMQNKSLLMERWVMFSWCKNSKHKKQKQTASLKFIGVFL